MTAQYDRIVGACQPWLAFCILQMPKAVALAGFLTNCRWIIKAATWLRYETSLNSPAYAPCGHIRKIEVEQQHIRGRTINNVGVGSAVLSHHMILVFSVFGKSIFFSLFPNGTSEITRIISQTESHTQRLDLNFVRASQSHFRCNKPLKRRSTLSWLCVRTRQSRCQEIMFISTRTATNTKCSIRANKHIGMALDIDAWSECLFIGEENWLSLSRVITFLSADGSSKFTTLLVSQRNLITVRQSRSVN